MHSLRQNLFVTFMTLTLLACQSEEKKIVNPYADNGIRKQREALGLVPRGLDLSRAPQKIVFGCCADQDQAQPIWKAILEEKPDLLLSMGDHIQATEDKQRPIVDQYKKLVKVDDYKKARETMPFMATWDDLDYGQVSGGASNPHRDEARKAFWFHFPYIKDSTLLDQAGIFHSKVLGGVKEGRGRRARTTPSVHVIMLDTRWNRTNPTDAKATILGADQWEWLEDQLNEPSDFKVLVSSIQVLPEGHVFDKWSQFPKEKEKLLNLITKTKPKNFVILSGDRKLAAISKIELKGFGTLHEVTAGSFNIPQELVEKEEVYLNEAYPKENYGLISLDWTKRTAAIEIKNLEGKPVQTLELKLKK